MGTGICALQACLDALSLGELRTFCAEDPLVVSQPEVSWMDLSGCSHSEHLLGVALSDEGAVVVLVVLAERCRQHEGNLFFLIHKLCVLKQW